jgi:FkbM family methyltransferase
MSYNNKNTINNDATHLIVSAYRSLLDREPDSIGMESWLKSWRAGEQNVEKFLRAIIYSEEFQKKSLKIFLDTNPKTPCILENSQYGEVGLLIQEIVSDSCPHKILVDIGARGKERSNSYDLISAWGWRGLLIEANPDLIPDLKNLYNGSSGIVIHSAISDFEGEVDFYMGSNLDVSSITKSNTASWGAVDKSVKVKCQRIIPLLMKHEIPFDFELLTIDIEGEDIKVINDLVLGSHYRPRYIIVEASFDFSVKKLDDIPLDPIVKNSYSICNQTRSNLILKKNASNIES